MKLFNYSIFKISLGKFLTEVIRIEQMIFVRLAKKRHFYSSKFIIISCSSLSKIILQSLYPFKCFTIYSSIVISNYLWFIKCHQRLSNSYFTLVFEYNYDFSMFTYRYHVIDNNRFIRFGIKWKRFLYSKAILIRPFHVIVNSYSETWTTFIRSLITLSWN